MKIAEFNKFKAYVETADMKDPIWWAGYLWIDLTAKQGEKMAEVLVKKGMGKFDADGKHFAEMPSGLRIMM